jgi:hypothetical protein
MKSENIGQVRRRSVIKGIFISRCQKLEIIYASIQSSTNLEYKTTIKLKITLVSRLIIMEDNTQKMTQI